MKKTLALLSFILLISCLGFAQPFTHADTLRGTYGPSRNWWDVTKYNLFVCFNLKDSSISGYNDMQFKILSPGKQMQIDLQEPLELDSIFLNEENKVNKSESARSLSSKLPFSKDGNAYFIQFDKRLKPNIRNLKIYYHGKPKISVRPPWLPGGMIWKKDKLNRPWISIACQGQGASVWYPCKDHQADEPDSAEMHITCPDTLMCVGNGRYRGKIINRDGTATYDWAVVNPINNYCIIPYLGKYVNFHETLQGEKGNLDMDYWVLDYNLEQARKQFKDAPRMIKAFEHWFGPYPFYEDGYKLVDAPHLGMEHQSATAYGNGYQNGYHGMDLSGSGWGMKWDFIIVHESGHEWFANNITTKDIADMWVHEGFTAYSESLFTEYYYGKGAAEAYVTGTRRNIENKATIIGNYNVNDDPSARGADMYYKGANMLHTIRQLINNDEKFRDILRGLNKQFYHQTVTSKQVETYIIEKSGIDLSKVFDQYLRTTIVPELNYKIKKGMLFYRWGNTIPGFKMPVKVMLDEKSYTLIYPTETLKEIRIKRIDLKIDPAFYVLSKALR